MNLKEKKKLLKLLKNAYVTCGTCGETYGVYSVGCSSVWSGKCDVCKKDALVTETRDYAYFFPTVRRLTLEIQAHVSD